MDVLAESLPAKEKANVIKLFELYDAKKYKKCLKLVDKLLEKSPKVTEYRVMRALVWLHISESAAEALTMAKEALKGSLGNPFSWHTCGTIYQKMHNYKEAGKCFERVAKINPQSLSALRNTINVHLHTRDYLAHRDICHKALLAHAETHQNWAAYALALRLLHQFPQSVMIVDELVTLMRRDGKAKASDLSGLLQFKAETLREAGRFEELATFLRTDGGSILNKEVRLKLELCAFRETKDAAASHKALLALIDLNPHNAEVVSEFLRHGPESMTHKLQLLQEKRSLCAAVEFLKIDNIGDDEWQAEFNKLYLAAADRFVPSFTRIARQLGRLPNRRPLVEATLIDGLATFTSSLSPTAELFALFVLADWNYALRKLPAALEFALQACDHTPSFEDAHILKAKILLAQGEVSAACAAARFAARLNTSDRALATSVARLLFRANRFEEADALFKQFIKGEDEVVEKNLHELQMSDFQLMRARTLLFRRQWTAALRQYAMLDEHFSGYFEDQLDFYSYGLRRFSPQPLYDIIKLNDGGLHRHKKFARNAIEYLHALLTYQRWCARLEQADEAEKLRIKEMSEEAAFCFPACISGNGIMKSPLTSEFVEQEKEKICLRLLRFDRGGEQPELHTALLLHFTQGGRWLAAGRSALHLLKSPPTAGRLKALKDFHQQLKKSTHDAPVIAEISEELAQKLESKLAGYQLEAKSHHQSSAEILREVIDRGELDEGRKLLESHVAAPEGLSFSEVQELMELASNEPVAYYTLAKRYFSPDPPIEDAPLSGTLDEPVSAS